MIDACKDACDLASWPARERIRALKRIIPRRKVEGVLRDCGLADRGGRRRSRGRARAQIQLSYFPLGPKSSLISRYTADGERDGFTHETIVVRLYKQHGIAASGNRFRRDLPAIYQSRDNRAICRRKPVYRGQP